MANINFGTKVSGIRNVEYHTTVDFDLGLSEYVIWGGCPMEAILFHTELDRLRRVADVDKTCADWLCLDLFQAGLSTGMFASRMRDKGNTLNTKLAKSMAQVAKWLGLDGQVQEEHIAEFVKSLVCFSKAFILGDIANLL